MRFLYPRMEILGPTLALLTIIILLFKGLQPWRHEPKAVRPLTGQATEAYVGRQACAPCHPSAARTYAGSGHDLALQDPTAQTVSGDFRVARFQQAATTTLFHRDGDRFQVTIENEDDNDQTHTVAQVFGHFPLEQYLIAFPDGRLQALTICWDNRPAAEGGQRWFSLTPDDPPLPGDPFHWQGLLQNWNFMCAECHSTRVRRGYDPVTDTYHTRFAEPDVSCEACHGPGSAHIAFERARLTNPGRPDPDGRRGLVLDLAPAPHTAWVFAPGANTAHREGPPPAPEINSTCARCHSRRTQIHEDYRHGRPFGDHHRLTLLEEGLYHADGQNRDEVFVYGSFLQTKMHAAGVTCLDCHDPHSGRPLGQGDQVCARCHRAEVYAAPAHHHHPPGKGDSCLDCHMRPVRVMGVDDRRDHGFRIPRPDLSLSLGIPNACHACHQDHDAAWARAAVVQWYGPDVPPHFAPALQAARQAAPGALDSLRSLITAPATPVIVRATALALIPRYIPASEEPLLVRHLAHPDPLLRAAATRALMSSEPQRRLALALPLVDDAVRDVRLAAAEVVADLRPEQLTSRDRADLQEAHDLWQEYLENYQDRPEILELLARFHDHQGRPQDAQEARRRAASLLSPGSPGTD